MLKLHLKKILKALAIAGSVLLLSTASIRLPQLHNDYIRSSVGSQTVMIKSGRSGGTGFFVKTAKGQTYVLTNRHICELAIDERLTVHVQGEARPYSLRVIERSNSADLCLVEAPKHVGGGLVVADSLDLGQIVRIVGHPKLMPLTQSKGEYVGEEVIDLLFSNGPCPEETDQFHTEEDWGGPVCIMSVGAGLTNALALGGNSGSPTVNDLGQVVGVLFAGNPSDNWGLIVRLSDIKEFLKIY